MSHKKNCLFCKFVEKKLDAPIIFENNFVLAFLDIQPTGNLEGHTLVIPKNHYKTLMEVPEKELFEVIKVIKKLSEVIEKVSGGEGINILQNNGKVSGQYIPHVHFHLIPRDRGDGIYFDTKRREMKPMEQFEVAKAIKGALK